MSNESFIQAIPKVELNIRLEGAFRKETLLSIADENEIDSQTKQFKSLVASWDTPDFSDLWVHFKSYTEWLNYPDNLTRLVYDAGLTLAKQNVRYAEMSVNPGLHMLPGMSFDEMMDAINDGRDKIHRGWGLRINWVLTVSRDEPRLADDVIRWASSAKGQSSGIVALGLSGLDSVQPAGQFERAFNMAARKEVPTSVQAGNTNGSEGILDGMILRPTRLVDGFGIVDNPDLTESFREDRIPLIISLGRAKKHGWIDDYSSYPLQDLLDAGVDLILSADLPNIYGNTLNDEYLIAHQECSISLDRLITINNNAINASFLSSEEKMQLVEEFSQEVDQLRHEHLTTEQ